MIVGLKRAIIILDEAIEESIDLMHTESLEYAIELLEKEIDRLKQKR